MLLAPAVLASTGSPVGSWFPYLLALRALFSYRLQHRGQPRLSHFSADRHRGVPGDHSQDTPRIEVFLSGYSRLGWMVQPKRWLGSSTQLPGVLICRIGACPGKYSVVGVGPPEVPVTGAAVSVTVDPLID